MIKIIMGLKGTGKTKSLIEQVNAAVKTNSGDVVCIEKDRKLVYDVSHKARLISASEYEIDTYDKFFGFLCGLAAGNYDISTIYIDSIMKICKGDIAELEAFVIEIEKIIKNIDIVITASYDEKLATETIKNHF